MIHANEPNMDELKSIRKELYAAEFTVEVEKKIKAIESQIERHKAEDQVE
jgi:hypothetical protein